MFYHVYLQQWVYIAFLWISLKEHVSIANACKETTNILLQNKKQKKNTTRNNRSLLPYFLRCFLLLSMP